MVKNYECTSKILQQDSDQEIQITISRRAFTWDIMFYPKSSISTLFSPNINGI